MKIAIILGTLSEVIKMSPLIRECEKQGINFYVLHTVPHYSYDIDRVFFEQLKLHKAKYNLDTGSGKHGEQTGKMLARIEEILLLDTPDVAFVQGDTNPVLAGALASSKLHIKIGHVEAGLRSFDRSMPEEINWVVVDHISDYLFALTETFRQYLLNEGIPEKRILVIGNTIVDAVYQNLEISIKRGGILYKFMLPEKDYLVATTQRAENVDNKSRLSNILNSFSQIYKEFKFPIIFPAHPRTVKMINEFGFDVTKGTRLIEPLGYFEFLQQLESGAKLILTGSEGIQEEACIMKVPCVTLRNNTERPETVDVRANLVAGTGKLVIEYVLNIIKYDTKWINPYGNGNASKLILKELKDRLGQFC